MRDPLRNSTTRVKGSPEYFHHFWTNATERDYAYPRLIPRTQWDLFEREKTHIIDRILLESGMVNGLVLEYGCGSAGMSVYLANKGFKVMATDINREAMKVAKSNFEANKSEAFDTNFTLGCADALRLPFQESTFDIVMSYGLLEHFDLESLTHLLDESRRVLKPGGLLMGDIVQGNFSSRQVAIWLNFTFSCIFNILHRRFGRIPSLYSAYFDPFYENNLNITMWKEQLQRSGFSNVSIIAIRPFPPLAITGFFERIYIAFMERMLRFYRWFDESQSWFSRAWGWTYLFWAIKPENS